MIVLVRLKTFAISINHEKLLINSKRGESMWSKIKSKMVMLLKFKSLEMFSIQLDLKKQPGCSLW